MLEKVHWCEVTMYGFGLDKVLRRIIRKHSVIKNYAFICHDRDRVKGIGLVPPHYHIYLFLSEARERFDIADWFGVSLVHVQKLRLRRMDYISYLLHDIKPPLPQGMARYCPSEITSNFDIFAES